MGTDKRAFVNLSTSNAMEGVFVNSIYKMKRNKGGKSKFLILLPTPCVKYYGFCWFTRGPMKLGFHT